MMRLRREDPRVVGTFRLHRRLGAGGMGVVYLGSDKRGQRVALKVIRPDLAEDQEFRSRFAREVSAARRIRGGCTARLVAADLDADRPWFATQYVPGPSLHDKVNEEGPLSPAQVASVGAALSEGLLAVHDAGVVHRDLKPSNILLSPKGPRIIDFGIAWATGASTLTHVGTAVGSPGFLAPEQVRGAAVTPATDIFALGATLAYACTADSPSGREVRRSCSTAWSTRRHSSPGCRTRWRRCSPRAWPRIRRTGPAPCRCRCASRRSRPVRHTGRPTDRWRTVRVPGPVGSGASAVPRTGRPGGGPRSTPASRPSDGRAAAPRRVRTRPAPLLRGTRRPGRPVRPRPRGGIPGRPAAARRDASRPPGRRGATACAPRCVRRRAGGGPAPTGGCCASASSCSWW